MIQTVLGPIPDQAFGFALPHEHVLCDFIGAEKTGRHRWDVETVVQAMRPRLLAVKAKGIASFVDCTPAYIGRDPRVLKRLAQETGLHLVTNTGYYGGAHDKFVPKHAETETAERLAARWIAEWEGGIEETGVRPGFLKIGVDEATGDPRKATLSPLDDKLVRAAAQASRKTGLAVTCHTGGGPAGLAATRRFIASGGKPSRFIVAHSDGHGRTIHEAIADRGAWVSFDGIGWRETAPHVADLLPLLKSHAERLLLSQDAGWWWAGEPEGGKIRGYTYLVDDFLPALRAAGVAEATIRKLTIANPAAAFSLPDRAP